MKKIMIFAAFVAALLLSSCKEVIENDAPVASTELITVNFNAAPVQTRTLFGDKNGSKYPVLWQAGDQICPSFNFAAPDSKNYIAITPESGGTSASFNGTFAESADYQFIFVSPAAAFKSCNKTNQTVMVEFPSGQTSTAASPDPAAQILYANTGVIAVIPNPVNLEFEHLTAYLHIQFDNVNLGTATLQAVNVTSADYPLAGRSFYHVDTDTFEASTEIHTVAVTTSTLTDVWCAVCPCDLSSKQLTVVISTDEGTMTKTVTMPASANLTRGKIGKFTVDMDGVGIVAPVVYTAISSASDLNVGDRVIIAAAGEDQAFAMSTAQNTNNRSAAGVSKTDTEISNPTDAVEVFEVENGTIPGHYAFRATGAENPGYIYAANPESSGSNILKTKNTKDNSASWAISVEDVTVSEKTWVNATRMFADVPSTGRGLLRFNSNDKLFAAYGNGTTQEAIKIYRLNGAAALSFDATLPNGSDITAAAQDVTVYVWGNVAWTAAASGEGATLDVTSGTGNSILTLSVPANESTASTKAYSVTVTTAAAVGTQSYTLNITQAKKIDAGGDPVSVYSFFLASAGNNLGSNGTYAGNCDVEISNITWNVTGVSNSGDYAGWRLGGKNISGTNRAIYSKTALADEVTKIVVSHSRANITINSFTLTVHSTAGDAATGASPIASLTETVNVGTQAEPATTTFTKADATSWAGCYFRLVYNVTNSTSTNKYVEFRGLDIWGYPAS